ncbi:MAG: hypothetical protein JWM15_1211, partial [Cryptosporangiaceae bacterium]|nr:hypothetical protein [Cryptosporangiaceae bacterium]
AVIAGRPPRPGVDAGPRITSVGPAARTAVTANRRSIRLLAVGNRG